MIDMVLEVVRIVVHPIELTPIYFLNLAVALPYIVRQHITEREE